MIINVDTSYQSVLYYDVVFGNGEYKGWYTTFVGVGAMHFLRRGEDTIKFKEKEFYSDTWMKDCWEDFIKYVDNLK